MDMSAFRVLAALAPCACGWRVRPAEPDLPATRRPPGFPSSSLAGGRLGGELRLNPSHRAGRRVSPPSRPSSSRGKGRRVEVGTALTPTQPAHRPGDGVIGPLPAATFRFLPPGRMSFGRRTEGSRVGPTTRIAHLRCPSARPRLEIFVTFPATTWRP